MESGGVPSEILLRLPKWPLGHIILTTSVTRYLILSKSLTSGNDCLAGVVSEAAVTPPFFILSRRFAPRQPNPTEEHH